METSFNYKKIAKKTGILFLGLFLGWFFFGGSAADDQPESMDEHVHEAHTDEQGNILYTCSMHPSVRESEPGNCPICGMELIPVGGDSSTNENPYELTMTPTAMRLAEVQTTEISRGTATKTVRMPGKITVDERRVKSLPAHFPGRVEELYANFTGEYISKGSRVASVYSPELVTAQKELLETAKHKEQNPTLYRAARTKLRNWKVSENQINEIESSGEVKTEFDVLSHMGGYVMEKNIDVGDHVQIGTIMYKMA
ncbi:MAG TPA: efflux RND transporter periplasmic adaptor subunit, partial [Fodinibius sp.]|nr:efflux RND transporter periplasmic adaptor subunit [Fodinibius sp.]